MYLIEGIVVYDKQEDVGYLYSIEDNVQKVTLNRTATKIFDLLLLSNGHVLKYEWFLYLVWEREGLKGSYNNLAYNISKLRKTLCDFGIEGDTICNKPHEGYFVKFKYVQKKTVIKKENEDIAVTKKIKLKVRYIFILLISAISLMHIVFYFQDLNIDGAHYIGRLEQCKVFTFDRPNYNIKKAIIQKLKSDNIIECNNDYYIFVQFNLLQDENKNLDDLFIGQCVMDRNKILNCLSITYEK